MCDERLQCQQVKPLPGVLLGSHESTDPVRSLLGRVDVPPQVGQVSLREQDRHVRGPAVRLQAVQHGRCRIEIAFPDGGERQSGAQQQEFRFCGDGERLTERV